MHQDVARVGTAPLGLLEDRFLNERVHHQQVRGARWFQELERRRLDGQPALRVVERVGVLPLSAPLPERSNDQSVEAAGRKQCEDDQRDGNGLEHWLLTLGASAEFRDPDRCLDAAQEFRPA